MKVAVLGASPNKERYSNKAVRELLAHGHDVIPVNPAQTTIEGLPVAKSLRDINQAVDTLTVYVGPQHIGALLGDIEALAPKRVIINPGAESPELTARLRQAGIRYEEACTLVMLRTGQF